jgi:acetyl-CoA synthetase
MHCLADLQAELARQAAVPADLRWQQLSSLAVAAKLPAAACRQLWEENFAHWPLADGPPPVWLPDPQTRAQANLTHFMSQQGCADLIHLRRWAEQQRVEFWQAVVQTLQIRFQRPPTTWFSNPTDPARGVWCPGAELNIALSCLPELDSPAGAAWSALSPAQAAGRPAMVWQSSSAPRQTISAQQLARQVQRIAAGIVHCGWAGRRLALILPLSPIGVAFYLAAIYTGSPVISIADSFSSPEIASRLTLAQAEIVVTYDWLSRGEKRLPLLDRVQRATALPCLVVGGGAAADVPGAWLDWDEPWGSSTPGGLRPQDMDWNHWLREAGASLCPAPAYVAAESPLHFLFSSGTTGEPKVIPWTPLTPIKCAADGYFHQDIHPTDVVAWPTNLGWMMGPWLIFATLLNRATLALYEDAPVGEGFGKFVADAQVTILGLVPSMVKAWRASRSMEACDWSRIRLFSSTGESSQRDDYFYLSWLAGFKPIIEYCGGTEIGGGYITSTVLEPNSPATFTGPALGLDIEILDDTGSPVAEGELLIVPPSIGLSQSLVNRDHDATYYQGVPRSPSGRQLRRHGDHFRRLPGGYFEAGGRTDDTMNLGGIKVSSLELERVVNRVPGVRESAAVACSRGGGPDTLVVFLVLDPSAQQPAGVVGPTATTEFVGHWVVRLNQAIRQQLNPLFKVAEVVILPQLPRTASNKILRRDLREQWRQRQANLPER